MQVEHPRVWGSRPRVMELVNTFHLGGAEGQVVELLRGLSSDFETSAAAIDAQGAHLQTVRGLGIEPFEMPLKGGLIRVNTPLQIARLAHKLRQGRVQLLHAHDFYSSLLAVPAARLAGAKVVVGRLDLGHWHGKGQRLALAAATRAADFVIANAEAVRRHLVETERLPQERIELIRNGIDLDRFDRARQAPLASPLPALKGRIAVAHVANMIHPVKAQEDLFEAVRALADRCPSLVVLLLGDGPRRPMLEQLVGQAGLGGRIHFLGHRPDVPAVLARCQIGVLCSHAEGLSNAIIEGMAAGLPMVVTDAGGNGELVSDGATGLVVPVRAPLALAEGIEKLASSEELRASLGAAARARVERELTLRRLVERHAALYRTVLGSPARASNRALDACDR